MDIFTLIAQSHKYAKKMISFGKRQTNGDIPCHFREGARYGYTMAVEETAKWIENNIAVSTPSVQKMLVKGYKRMMLEWFEPNDSYEVKECANDGLTNAEKGLLVATELQKQKENGEISDNDALVLLLAALKELNK